MRPNETSHFTQLQKLAQPWRGWARFVSASLLSSFTARHKSLSARGTLDTLKIDAPQFGHAKSTFHISGICSVTVVYTQVSTARMVKSYNAAHPHANGHV